MRAPFASLPVGNPTPRQRILRRRSRHLSLERAVCSAVDAFFGFEYRAAQTKALWCETKRVWLGRETFLYWALCDGEMNIPWVVATASDAPDGEDDFSEAVRAALTAYWTDRIAALPMRAKPRWLPLP